jgi:hypothetical protein
LCIDIGLNNQNSLELIIGVVQPLCHVNCCSPTLNM